MPHWKLLTAPARDGDPLAGVYADADLTFRLHCLVDMITKAQAALTEAERQFDADAEAAKRNGQGRIVDEAVRRLAERRPRG
jgi:hypothetical protein